MINDQKPCCDFRQIWYEWQGEDCSIFTMRLSLVISENHRGIG
jgi:hypothetical protein